MPNDQTEHNKKLLLEALESTLGVVHPACKQAGLSRTQFYQWKKDDPEFAKAVKEIKEVAIDFAESKLHQQIKDNNTTATIFFLKTQGKNRGYIETSEVLTPDTARPPAWFNNDGETT